MNETFKKLLSFIEDKTELKACMENINACIKDSFVICLNGCFAGIRSAELEELTLRIESILDYLHDELNTGHWSEVPIDARRAFTGASYVKTLILSKKQNPDFGQCLKCLDLGLLLGAPLEHNAQLLTQSATLLMKQSSKTPVEASRISSNKRKISTGCSDSFTYLSGGFVDCLNRPSMETFNNKYFSKKNPVKLQDCVTNWPALEKWTDLNYLLEVAGDRTVPVEIGSHYADENWSQKLMTLKDFIKTYFLGHTENVGYLAQHNLFNQVSTFVLKQQIPELRNDIHIPEYCCLSDDDHQSEEEPAINAWLGPANTVSPLHHDPKNNILVQVFGTKQLILYSPDESENLYPHDGTLLSNTGQVDPLNPNLEKHPNFAKARAYKCLLAPGEMLYIPPKWWHHVVALDKSFSVSFWWN